MSEFDTLVAAAEAEFAQAKLSAELENARQQWRSAQRRLETLRRDARLYQIGRAHV